MPLFPETPVACACFPNVFQFCHTVNIVSSVKFQEASLLLLHGRNILCFCAAWEHGKTMKQLWKHVSSRGAAPPPPPEMTCGFLAQLVFCKKNNSVIPFPSGVPPPKKNPGFASGFPQLVGLILTGCRSLAATHSLPSPRHGAINTDCVEGQLNAEGYTTLGRLWHNSLSDLM